MSPEPGAGEGCQEDASLQRGQQVFGGYFREVIGGGDDGDAQALFGVEEQVG